MDPFTIAIMVASTAYQQKQASKLKKQQAAAAEERKGAIFSVSNEVISLPLVYGRQLVGGVQFDHKIRKDYIYAAPENGCDVFLSNAPKPYTFNSGVSNNLQAKSLFSHEAGSDTTDGSSQALGSNVLGTKNEFMFAKHAICHAGIHQVVHVQVNGNAYNHRDFKKGQRIVVHPEGGTSSLLQNNGYPALDKFTGVCYADEVFRLDREENNYSGAPDVQYMIEGMKVYSVLENSGVYSLSSTKSYSNNPANVLLDYLTNDVYGKGLSANEINLQSFYEAAQICDTTVKSGAVISGHALGAKPSSVYPSYSQFPDSNSWGFEDVYLKANDTGLYYQWVKIGGTDKDPQGQFQTVVTPTRNIPLYECNVTLSTENSIRDNVEEILNSMNYAELTWDNDGKYKLSLEYPANDAATNALVTTDFDEDNILLDNFDISFPSAIDRFNHCTVSFLNEHKDFKTDTVSWPPRGSTIHNTYSAEDNYQPFETSLSPTTISNPYHALAKAEQIVRSSRSIFTVRFKATREALVVEPGDFISVKLEEAGITTPTVFRVQSIAIDEDFNSEIEAYLFDADVLSWNIADDVAYPEVTVFDFLTPNVTNLVLDQNSVSEYKVGKLTWDNVDDDGSGNFSYEVCYKKDTDSDYLPLGTSNTKYFEFTTLEDLGTHSSYDFKVLTRSVLGQRSTGTEITSVTVDNAPGAVSSLNVVEELYITNNASGVKSRALLSWTPDNSGLNSAYFLVEYKKNTESVFTTAGTVSSDHITVPDVSHSAYDFKVTPFSDFGFSGPAVTFQKNIVGLSAAPATPTNFSGNINEGQINLSWDLSTDLDVIYGGSCEIRFHNETSATASWETASVLVDSLSGNTNNKTVPTLQGTFFIKFKDSRGHYSTNAASFISNFFDNSFNQIDLITEHTAFSGTKVNCTKNNGYLELDVNQTTMTYSFSNVLDLGEVISVRVSPQLDTSVTLRGVDVDDYADVSVEQNFAGPLQNAVLKVEVSTTQDDPNGASPTWTSYELLTIGSFTCRGLRFRFIGIAENTNTRILVNELGILVDKKDVIKTGTSTSSVSGDTQVTFAVPFYAGIGGGSNPTIGYGIIGGQSNDVVVITSRNKDGFYYSVFHNNSRVQRTIDWQAIGQ